MGSFKDSIERKENVINAFNIKGIGQNVLVTVGENSKTTVTTSDAYIENDIMYVKCNGYDQPVQLGNCKQVLSKIEKEVKLFNQKNVIGKLYKINVDNSYIFAKSLSSATIKEGSVVVSIDGHGDININNLKPVL